MLNNKRNSIFKKIVFNIIIVLTVIVFSRLQADELLPQPIEVQTLNWIGPPPVPGLMFTWVAGSEQKQGLYALRVKLEQNTKIPPHTHPDQRLSTVLSGTLYVGFGESFDENKLVAIESGNAYVAPAQTSHFIWAKDGEVIYQETGIGPTATKMINQ